MPRDDDRLLRQLSLVSFLLSQPRPVTAAEVRRSVEGYALMTDQGFARRFYDDRDDLRRGGICIEGDTSEEGAEAYHLPQDNYRLPDVAFTSQELTALSVALALLEGRFAYARLLRLGLASLTHGHPDPAQEEVDRVAVALAPDEEAGHLGPVVARFDDAVARGKTVSFEYTTAEGGTSSERVLDPYALVRVGGHWYAVGRDHARDDIRMFRLSRMAGAVRFSTKKPRDFTTPTTFDASAYRARPPWQLGTSEGDAVILVSEDLAWWVERSYEPVAVQETRSDGSVVFSTHYADPGALVDWALGLGTRLTVLRPAELRRLLVERLSTLRDTHVLPLGPEDASEGTQNAESVGRTTGQDEPGAEGPASRSATPLEPAAIRPDRLSRVLGLLHYLLDESRGERVALDDIKRDLGLDRAELETDLSLLNLVNHGGGTYVLYAELEEDHVVVEREPEGERMAHPARLSPLNARALLLALDLVGDVLPVEGRGSLISARAKIEQLVADAPLPGGVGLHDMIPADHEIVTTLNRSLREHLVVELEYYSVARDRLTRRMVEPYLLFHSGDSWYLEAYCRQAQGQRTFRVDRMRSAMAGDERFDPRPDIDLSGVQTGPLGTRTGLSGWALVRFPPAWERRLSERGLGFEVEDGALLARIPYLDERWLVREVMRYGGQAELLKPDSARRQVAELAATLVARYVES